MHRGQSERPSQLGRPFVFGTVASYRMNRGDATVPCLLQSFIQHHLLVKGWQGLGGHTGQYEVGGIIAYEWEVVKNGYEPGRMPSANSDCESANAVHNQVGFCYSNSGYAAMPRISTGMSRFDTPRCSRSQTNCSKYDSPVDIWSANDLTGTISTPTSIRSSLWNIVILAHTL